MQLIGSIFRFSIPGYSPSQEHPTFQSFSEGNPCEVKSWWPPSLPPLFLKNLPSRWPQKAGSCREDLQGPSPSNVTSSQNTGACRCVSEQRLPGGTGRVSFVRGAISYIMFSASLRACGLLVACLIIEAVARKLSQKVGCSRENGVQGEWHPCFPLTPLSSFLPPQPETFADYRSLPKPLRSQLY